MKKSFLLLVLLLSFASSSLIEAKSTVADGIKEVFVWTVLPIGTAVLAYCKREYLAGLAVKAQDSYRERQARLEKEKAEKEALLKKETEEGEGNNDSENELGCREPTPIEKAAAVLAAEDENKRREQEA